MAERSDSNPALFVSHSRRADGKRLTTRSVQRIVETAVAKLDRDASLTPHDFRHYQAIELLREGGPVEVVQEYLGHADISTTCSVYAPINSQQLPQVQGEAWAVDRVIFGRQPFMAEIQAAAKVAGVRLVTLAEIEPLLLAARHELRRERDDPGPEEIAF